MTRPAERQRAILYHCSQSRSNTCVAAAVCMVRRSRGETIEVAELIAAWGEPESAGYPVENAGDVIVPLPAIADIETGNFVVEDIAEALDDGWLVAPVFGGPMTVFASDLEPRPTSGFGVLCTAYREREDLLTNGGRPLHSIVMIAAERRHFTFLDPWFGPEGQPFRMPRTWFIRHAWAAALRRPG